MGKKLNIADLMAQKEKVIPLSIWVDVPELGGEIEVRRLPLARFMELSSKVAPDDPVATLQAQYEMIYAFCPILHEDELQKHFECQVPTDIVPKIFHENMGSMNLVVNAIGSFYTEPEAEEKN